MQRGRITGHYTEWKSQSQNAAYCMVPVIRHSCVDDIIVMETQGGSQELELWGGVTIQKYHKGVSLW